MFIFVVFGIDNTQGLSQRTKDDRRGGETRNALSQIGYSGHAVTPDHFRLIISLRPERISAIYEEIP